MSRPAPDDLITIAAASALLGFAPSSRYSAVTGLIRRGQLQAHPATTYHGPGQRTRLVSRAEVLRLREARRVRREAELQRLAAAGTSSGADTGAPPCPTHRLAAVDVR